MIVVEFKYKLIVIVSSKVSKTITRIKDDINDLMSDQVYDLSAKQAKISFNI